MAEHRTPSCFFLRWYGMGQYDDGYWVIFTSRESKVRLWWNHLNRVKSQLTWVSGITSCQCNTLYPQHHVVASRATMCHMRFPQYLPESQPGLDLGVSMLSKKPLRLAAWCWFFCARFTKVYQPDLVMDVKLFTFSKWGAEPQKISWENTLW